MEITVQTNINAPVEKVWKLWTTPADIMQWNKPADEWHTPHAQLDLKVRGRFLFRMETKDGSMGFDHSGLYDKIKSNELIEYTGTDGRKTSVSFQANGNETLLTETFEPELQTPVDVQKGFCQGVINNFKKYAEAIIE